MSAIGTRTPRRPKIANAITPPVSNRHAPQRGAVKKRRAPDGNHAVAEREREAIGSTVGAAILQPDLGGDGLPIGSAGGEAEGPRNRRPIRNEHAIDVGCGRAAVGSRGVDDIRVAQQRRDQIGGADSGDVAERKEDGDLFVRINDAVGRAWRRATGL